LSSSSKKKAGKDIYSSRKKTASKDIPGRKKKASKDIPVRKKNQEPGLHEGQPVPPQTVHERGNRNLV
jgi:hypothetical protein